MHFDARKLPNNTVIEGDVCIVGAGAAGISIATDWINSPHRVILLESGGFEYDDHVQDLYKGVGTGQRYYPLRSSRLSMFGGTTGHWAGMCSPFDEIDFMKRDWVPDSGWPITRQDLDPFYARANEKLKLGPYHYDLAYWQQQKPNLNAFRLDEKVVWHKIWQLSPAWGPAGGLAKVYKDDIVKAKNIDLFTYSTVVNLEATGNISGIREAHIRNHAGKEHTVKAKHFILAGGAIQNARMLLASNKQAKNGLGNDRDVVGRYFMEHLEIQTAELWLFKPFSTDLFTFDLGKNGLWCELAITKEAQIKNKILNGTTGLSAALKVARHQRPRMEVWQNEDPRKSADNMFRSWDAADSMALSEKGGAIEYAFEFQTRIEQAPNPNSRVTIGEAKDEFGVPLANLHWDLTELDKRSIRRLNELIGIEMGKANLGRVRLKEFLRDDNDMSWPEGTNAGWHHMGTTRMGMDPAKSVVDPNCQVHGINNLYVAGSACYVTAAAPNPTLTIVALSLRLSDYIKSKLK